MSEIEHRKETHTMTTTFKSGSAVQSGYYLNASRWHIEPIAKDGTKLPDGKGEWMKVSTPLALMLVPILGATFLMFLPVIGFILLAQAMTAPLLNMFRASAKDLAATVSPGWQPGEAHFTGKSPENVGVEEKGPIAGDAKLDALQAEIESKRQS
jgi:hypothetical protein